MKEFSFLLYTVDDSDIKVNAILKDETIWLSQKGMAELFGCSSDNISFHLKNIFLEGELEKDSVTEKFSATAKDGKNYLTQFYSLDAIISVGYRVNSKRATNFRIWATKVLKEYMIKGFALDDERLKQGKISRQDAWKKAQAEYDIFNRTQTIHSDFDEMVRKMIEKEVGQNE